MEFKPTFADDKEIGGSKNFGSQSFIPALTGVTGTYTTSGVYQRLGKILFWAFELTGTSTTTSAVFTPPVSPQRRHSSATYGADEISHAGICMDGTTVIAMNDAGTYALSNATTTNDVRRFSGWYWVN